MYEITTEDFLVMHERIAAGHDCYIPVRQPVELRGGKIVPMLSWGHPAAWELYGKDGKVYSRYRHES